MTLKNEALANLRQGDICELDLFPHWNLGTAFTVSQGAGATHLQVAAMPKVLPAKSNGARRLVVVCSYDCDLENPRDRTGLLIAPIFALSERNNRYDAIVQSGQMQTNADGQLYFNYLQYFPLEVAHVTAVETKMGVADFSAITSFGKAVDAVKFLQERKVHELSEETRTAFRAKLATFVGRPEVEIASFAKGQAA